jgi:phospholipid/cholesterol/gamma-HCH transport system substrate-binding protein
MDRIKVFSETITKIQEGEGTIGKLLKDPTLYNNANATVEHVKELIVKLEPMVNDLRMFSDSLARDPRQLGLRGAIDMRALGTGYKGNVTGRNQANTD